jgi:hypothetical protein
MHYRLVTRTCTFSLLAIATTLCSGGVPTPAPFAEMPDDHYVEIAKRVPGFAGWWLDGTTAVVMLVDTTQRRAAVQALEPDMRGVSIRTIRVQRAQFDFIQLRNWKRRVPFDTLIHVTLVDADEMQNRVVVGVADSVYLGPARKRLLALGIPAEALALEVVPYAEFR